MWGQSFMQTDTHGMYSIRTLGHTGWTMSFRLSVASLRRFCWQRTNYYMALASGILFGVTGNDGYTSTNASNSPRFYATAWDSY